MSRLHLLFYFFVPLQFYSANQFKTLKIAMMEHRKRSMLQHKVELPTLVRIVMANGDHRAFRSYGINSHDLAKTLASEAMESLKTCDHADSGLQQGKVYAADIVV
jgi:hypothetical protein